MIAHLTGTEIANASMYDGASAMAEAAVLCAKMSDRTKILMARSVHPEYRRVLQTYAWANGYTVEEIPYAPTGQLDMAHSCKPRWTNKWPQSSFKARIFSAALKM